MHNFKIVSTKHTGGRTIVHFMFNNTLLGSADLELLGNGRMSLYSFWSISGYGLALLIETIKFCQYHECCLTKGSGFTSEKFERLWGKLSQHPTVSKNSFGLGLKDFSKDTFKDSFGKIDGETLYEQTNRSVKFFHSFYEGENADVAHQRYSKDAHFFLGMISSEQL
ncbi:hypothetical protein [Vibrio harveyi]|uniref:hypothetical protein n=1 Tax=Vibrio harveyi TaxID=669 RepID=UPI003D75C23C